MILYCFCCYVLKSNMHYVRLKSANIEFTKEASSIPLPYHSSTPHAADQLGASASGMASPTQPYRSLIAPLTDRTWSPAETYSHAHADYCFTHLSPTTILVTRPTELTSLGPNQPLRHHGRPPPARVHSRDRSRPDQRQRRCQR